MKRTLSIAIMFLAAAGVAMAQAGANPSTDVLGAHLNYGRGCTGCHAPHSGAAGAGLKTTKADPTSGNYALWGEDVSNLYGVTLNFGDTGTYSETLPSDMSSIHGEAGGILACLSCHDGNLAKGAMMKNQVYENTQLIANVYGTNPIPTLLGNDGSTAGNYMNDHPVGEKAIIGCGGSYNWDCTIDATNGKLQPGANMLKFINNYGFFVSPGVFNNQPIVLCTTCHNQHLMNVVKVSNNSDLLTNPAGYVGKDMPSGVSGLTAGYYTTMFFIRAPYNPLSGTTGSNQTAQFCRQCHGGEANELNNSSAGTTF